MSIRHIVVVPLLAAGVGTSLQAQSSCSTNGVTSTVTMTIPLGAQEAATHIDRALAASGHSIRSMAPNVLMTTRGSGNPATVGGLMVKFREEGGVVRVTIHGRDVRRSTSTRTLSRGDALAGPDNCALAAVTDSLVRWTGARVEPTTAASGERDNLNSLKGLKRP